MARKVCDRIVPVTTEPARKHPPSGAARGPVRRWLGDHPDDVIDVFVYVVVLNLAIEYVPAIISESFTLSLLTALLLKISLEVVILLKSYVVAGLRAASTRRAKVVIGATLVGGCRRQQVRRSQVGRSHLR